MKLQIKGNTFIATIDGEVYISNEITTSQLETLMSVNVTEAQVLEIFNPKLQEVKAFNKEVESISNTLLESGLFEERNGSYYRVGNPISVPKMLLEKYKAVVADTMHSDTTVEALDNFWLKCSLNPNVYARENLFEFLQKWGFVITSNGYIVGYRNVDVRNEGNRQLHDFVALNYTKIKSQKKAPKNYLVYNLWADNEKYILFKEDSVINDNHKFIGNLQDLYNNLSNLSETVYTDHHTGKMRITIGEVVSIPKEECDQSQTECSRGLHIGGTSWLKKNYYGSVGLVCLINPMDVVSCPNAGSYGKMRTASYLPIGLAEYDDEGNIIPVASDLFEDDYDTYTIEELNKLLQEVNPSNQVIHKLEPISLTTTVFKTIDQYRETILDRVVKLYEEDFINDEDGDYDDDEYGYDYLDEEE